MFWGSAAGDKQRCMTRSPLWVISSIPERHRQALLVMTHWNCEDLANVLSLAVPGEEADHGAGAAVPGVPQDPAVGNTPQPEYSGMLLSAPRSGPVVR
jgi:hypothetical protein